jgi:hypothetical protein
MNRTELAKELSVWPWVVDEWLLLGCPAKKERLVWDFNFDRVKTWLKAEKIRIKRIKPKHSPKSSPFDIRWFGGRCPICIDRGFPGEKAGRLYTLGEMLEGEWHLRRAGIPCGHSIDLGDGKNGNFHNRGVKDKIDLPLKTMEIRGAVAQAGERVDRNSINTAEVQALSAPPSPNILNGREKIGKRRNIWEKGKLHSQENNAGIRGSFRNISV